MQDNLLEVSIPDDTGDHNLHNYYLFTTRCLWHWHRKMCSSQGQSINHFYSNWQCSSYITLTFIHTEFTKSCHLCLCWFGYFPRGYMTCLVTSVLKKFHVEQQPSYEKSLVTSGLKEILGPMWNSNLHIIMKRCLVTSGLNEILCKIATFIWKKKSWNFRS